MSLVPVEIEHGVSVRKAAPMLPHLPVHLAPGGVGLWKGCFSCMYRQTGRTLCHSRTPGVLNARSCCGHWSRKVDGCRWQVWGVPATGQQGGHAGIPSARLQGGHAGPAELQALRSASAWRRSAVHRTRQTPPTGKTVQAENPRHR